MRSKAIAKLRLTLPPKRLVNENSKKRGDRVEGVDDRIVTPDVIPSIVGPTSMVCNLKEDDPVPRKTMALHAKC